MPFYCVLWKILELDSCRCGFFLKGCSVRDKDCVNIVMIGLSRFVDLKILKDCIVDDMVNIISGLIFLWRFAIFEWLGDRVDIFWISVGEHDEC